MDAARMDRVLMNLVGNALKFTPREGRVSLGAAEVEGKLQVWVEDSGPGIPEELRPKIFEPYQQGRNGKGGVGLGLTIVRTFVEAHGGRVWIEGPPAGGARFVVELPLEPISAGNA
jgi:signal transduction histidine kinase